MGVLVAVVANPIAPHGPMVPSWMAMSRPAHRQEDQKQVYNKSMTTNQNKVSHDDELIANAEELEKVRYITIVLKYRGAQNWPRGSALS